MLCPFGAYCAFYCQDLTKEFYKKLFSLKIFFAVTEVFDLERWSVIARLLMVPHNFLESACLRSPIPIVFTSAICVVSSQLLIYKTTHSNAEVARTKHRHVDLSYYSTSNFKIM